MPPSSLGLLGLAYVAAAMLDSRHGVWRLLKLSPLADEPTGNLDSTTGERNYALLKSIAQERMVVVVTHAEPLASLVDWVVHLKDGRVAA